MIDLIDAFTTLTFQDLIHALKLHPEMGNPDTPGSPADSKVASCSG